MIAAEVAIVGAGPAGATAALNLAPYRSVALIDRRAAPQWRIGESLPGAARRLLSDMDLWDDFCRDGHRPCHAFRSLWGGGGIATRETMRDPDGPAWQIDRARFEARLRAVAAARGARLLMPARPIAVVADGRGWRLSLDHDGAAETLTCRLLIDAGGRGSRLLSEFGAVWQARDRLVCAFTRYDAALLPPGIVHIEAEPDGWWYATGLADGATVIAFHTDADLPAARAGRSVMALAERVSTRPMLGALLRGRAATVGAAGFCAAHSGRLGDIAGPNWLAVGDAAMAFDPLAAQGIYNALYTGLAGAEAAHRALSGDAAALGAYAAEMKPVAAVYDAHLAAWYGTERRFADRAFWRRRLGAASTELTDRPRRDAGVATPG